MIDSLCLCKEKAVASDVRTRLGLEDGPYVLLTLHRPSNVDDPVILRNILKSIRQVSVRARVLFPVHPRTAAQIRTLRDPESGANSNGITFTNPLGRIDFLNLLMGASLVMTDSGGIRKRQHSSRFPA